MTNDTVSTPRLSEADRRQLQGRVVLVKSSRDQRNPPTGMRGWIEVRDSAEGTPEVCIAVEFPQMFTIPAHHRTFVLDDAGVAKLLRCEYNGVFEYTIDEELV